MSLVVALFGQANWVIEKARKSWGVRKGENQPAYLSGLIMRLGSLAGHRSRSNESCPVLFYLLGVSAEHGRV